MGDVQLPDVLHRRPAVREDGVRLGRHPLQQPGVLQDRVEHERADPRHRVEAGDEGPEHARPQIGLGQELGVGAVQLEQVVDEIGNRIAAARRVVRRRDLLVQLLGPRPGAAEAPPLEQAARPLPGDGGEQEGAHEDDEVVEIVPGRGAGGEDAQLVGGDALQRVVAGYRPVGGPRRDLAPHDLDHLGDVLFGRGLRVPPLHPGAHAIVLRAVHAHRRALRAQLCHEISPGLGAAQVGPAVLHQEHVGFGAGEDGERALERAHAEDRPQPLVFARQVGADVAGKAEGVAGHGNPRRRRRRQTGHRPFDGGGDRVPGERLRAELRDALPRALQLARRNELLEPAAGVDEADKRDVARGGTLVVCQRAGEALSEGLVVRVFEHRVAAGAKDAAPAVLLYGEGAACHQSVQGRLANLVRARCRLLHPGGDVVPIGRGMQPREQRIEQVVPERRRIGRAELRRAVADAVRQSQIDQQRAGEGVVHRPSPPRRQLAGLAVEQQQAERFGAGRPGPPRRVVFTPVVFRHLAPPSGSRARRVSKARPVSRSRRARPRAVAGCRSGAARDRSGDDPIIDRVRRLVGVRFQPGPWKGERRPAPVQPLQSGAVGRGERRSAPSRSPAGVVGRRKRRPAPSRSLQPGAVGREPAGPVAAPCLWSSVSTRRASAEVGWLAHRFPWGKLEVHAAEGRKPLMDEAGQVSGSAGPRRPGQESGAPR